VCCPSYKASGGQQFSSSLDELSKVEVARLDNNEHRGEMRTMQGLWRKRLAVQGLRILRLARDKVLFDPMAWSRIGLVSNSPACDELAFAQ
jgi:hypothetical protein